MGVGYSLIHRWNRPGELSRIPPEKKIELHSNGFYSNIYIWLHRGRTRYRAAWRLRWWYFATLVGCECMVLILVTIIMHAHLCVAVTTILQCNRTHKTQTNADTNYNTHNFCKTSVVEVLPSLLCCTLLLCSLLCCTISTASVLCCT